MKKVITIIAIVLVVVLLAGLGAYFFIGKPLEEARSTAPVEVEYEATFGGDFEEKYPISSLPNTDNMKVAPYAYQDTSLFSNKRITKIAVPVRSVTALDENQYFSLHVIKSATVKKGGIYTSEPYTTHKVYLPKEELTSTTVNKWVSIDLSDQFIYVGEDETLAFMSPDDPVICCYATIPDYNFVYDLGKAGILQPTQSIFYSIYTDDVVDLKGKTISILGDSISTFSGISNDATNTNNTIGSNAVYYPKGEIDKASETWWMQTANATGMTMLVNNSWSGSKVLTGGSAAYQTRCEQLHDNTGADSGTHPDIIAVYIGINDFNANLAIGNFSKLEDIYTEEEGYITPETVAEAYAIMIHKMITKYENADIFVLTLPANGTNKNTDTLASYNKAIRKIADYFDCHLVDIANIEGYDYAKYTMDGLHPNEQGMDLITELFVRKLEGVYGLPEKEESK